MRDGYITQVLTSVDIQELVKVGGKVIEIYEGVIYREIFEINPFEKVIDNLFASRQKYEDEGNDVMQLLVKLILNALYGDFLRKIPQKVINANLRCGYKQSMMREF